MNKKTLIRGVITTIFFGITLFILIPNYIDEGMFIPPNSINSSSWPKMISILGILMGVFLIIKSYKKPSSNNEHLIEKIYVIRFIIIIFSLVAYIQITPYLGFVLTTALLTIFLMITIQSNTKYIPPLLIGIVFSMLLFYVFTVAVKVTFPIGYLVENISYKI